MAGRTYPLAKRAFDLAGSAILLVLLGPFLLLIAAIIHFEDGGPALYPAPRVGWRGRRFIMYKFRTMVLNADRLGASSTAADDPRITRIGRFLRTHKLDELPQLLNVFFGSMSFVGPRPQVQWAVDRYSAREREVLEAVPGITDYASICFANEGEILRGSTDPDRDYLEKIHPRKMALNLKYVTERSFLLDCKLLAVTAAAVLGMDVSSFRQKHENV
ncbi:MAG TPA: sugar transferase [Opitutaceae bacterium]|nr:sugar transferase [Opitutaceae bacterium]